MSKTIGNKSILTKRASASYDKNRYSMTMTYEDSQNGLLKTIQGRNSNSGQKMDPETVSKVVKDYVLKPFKADFLEKSHQQRLKQYGVSHRRTFSDKNGTLFSDLKLSEKLADELKTVSKELQETKKKFYITEQEKYEYMCELKTSRETISQTRINLNILNQDNLLLNGELHKLKLLHELELKQLLEAKRLNTQFIEEKAKVSKEFEDLREKNDIRFMIKIFFNSLKNFKNQSDQAKTS